MAETAFMTQYQGMGGKGKMPMKHPGFAAVAKAAARRQGISMRRADAEIASGARKASAGAKRANPKLKKVSGA